MRRIPLLKCVLAQLGVDPRRLRLEWVSASEGQRFADIVTDFTAQLKALGPLPRGAYSPEVEEKAHV
jgi:F420-non-reducing hydrogenase iron-sulfur subunit